MSVIGWRDHRVPRTIRKRREEGGTSAHLCRPKSAPPFPPPLILAESSNPANSSAVSPSSSTRLSQISLAVRCRRVMSLALETGGSGPVATRLLERRSMESRRSKLQTPSLPAPRGQRQTPNASGPAGLRRDKQAVFPRNPVLVQPKGAVEVSAIADCATPFLVRRRGSFQRRNRQKRLLLPRAIPVVAELLQVKDSQLIDQFIRRFG